MEPLMVEASAAGDAVVIPGALLLGALLGALYDIFRILHMVLGLRRVSGVSRLSGRLASFPVRHIRTDEAQPGAENGERKREAGHETGEKTRRCGKAVLLFFLDILYFLLAAVCAVLFIYRENAGMLRWYLPVSMALGFAVWYGSAGKAVMRLSAVLLGAIRAALVFTYNHTLFYAVLVLWRTGNALKKRMGGIVSAVLHRLRAGYDRRRCARLAERTDRCCRAMEERFRMLIPSVSEDNDPGTLPF